MEDQNSGVLIAEPLGDQHDSLAWALPGDGSEVVAAHGAAEAVAMGRFLKPELVLVDLSLSPDCSLVADLLVACPETKIVAVLDSSEGFPHGLNDVMKLGAVAAVERTALVTDLVSVLSGPRAAGSLDPVDPAPVLSERHIDLSNRQEQQRAATSRALCAALEARDFGTGQHLHRVTRLATSCMRLIDASLALSDEVVCGFMLHDVGKIGVPDHILLKPGPLDYWEFETMRAHPELGLKIAEPGGFSHETLDVIHNHHERWDGFGYPRGLAGDEIPLTARVFSVADAYDAMTSDRPYRSAMSPRDALHIIRSGSGYAFDPEVVDPFLRLHLDLPGIHRRA
ncbi:MAG: HD-GYP domain-containing protein [Actinomycetota bacterium]|nr:HD-GYP domain-containing protein [Actinomycetota bacterium]